MKILICDDHKIVRQGISEILKNLSGNHIIEEAGDARDAINLIRSQNFNIMILDITLPDKNGLEVLQSVKNISPSTNVLILSMHPQEQYALRALKLGASGYLTKNTASEELIQAIETISDNRKFITKSLAELLASHIDEDCSRQKHEYLSGREFEIMVKLANGKSLNDIGTELHISNKTVGTYRSRIMGKMELNKNTELTKYCMANNLI